MAAPITLLAPALWAAAISGETEKARELLLGGANIEERGGMAPDLTTPLEIAVRQGRAALVKLLLEHGANTSTKDGERTLLHWAAICTCIGSGEVALLLLQHGADVSAKDSEDHGHTPLHLTALLGHGAVARVLLQNGADVSYTDGAGRTALHWAAFQGHEEVVRVLIELRANVSATEIHGFTPEDYATARSHLQVVAMLKAEAVTRAKCVAFAMGHQERLGAGSPVRWLDPEVVRMVLGRV